jgi:S1-C subfamily serine protease
MHGRRAAGAIIGIVIIIAGIIIVVAGDLGDGGDGGADDGSAGAIEVARVEAAGCDRPQTRSGVGTFVADDVVLTAAHVVEGGLRELRVGESTAVVVGIDARTDLALVALVAVVERDDSNISRDLPRWTVTPSSTPFSDVSPGPVRVVTPEESVDTRLIRTLTLRVEDVTAGTTVERQALELEAIVDEGDSGAPVVDSAGDLVGVVTLRRPSTGVSYASAVPLLTDLLDHAAYQEVRADPLARPHPCT